MSGKGQKIQYSLASDPKWTGVKPRSTVTEGPNHSGRSQYPKARP
jgi:hypothetical protein